MTSPARPLRVDAERNRRRILAAAGELFAERGVDVSMDDIATAAGVGVGTVYRRFPDRDALIEALFEEKLQRIATLAAGALEIEDPWDAFLAFFRAIARMQAEDRGLKQVLLSADRGRDRVAEVRNTIRPVAVRLLERAKAAGALREDLDTFDLPMMHVAVSAVAELTRDVAPAYWERLLAIFLDGLAGSRAGTTPMPAPPLDLEQFTTAMSRRR
ncbi:MAG TPA: helix-turn-helix domain-containing protein [Solirubrobacteraceae bacterium]|nr:helix-turn-helix domain-containing protein [Solirubrobacteraceae bacterium]